MTLKFEILAICCPVPPWNLTDDPENNTDLFYATASFVHYSVAIGALKLELHSGNAQFGSKLAIFWSRVTLKFDEWPWKNSTPLMDYFKLFTWWRHQMETFSSLLAICAGNSSVPGEFPAQRPVTRSFDVCLICVWIDGWVNNREAGDLRRHLDYYEIIVMTSFRSHLWNRIGVTVRKWPNWGKIWFDLCDLDLWPLALTFYMEITPVSGNYSENFMMIWLKPK